MKHKKLRALCEGAIMVALATALSYLKLLELPQGGSVCIGMLPIFLYSARWGVGPAFLTSFAYGLLQLLLDGAYAWGPTSMLLDYLLAFGVLGVAGFFHRKKGGIFIGTVVGCVCRFIVHFISGITIYKIYANYTQAQMNAPVTRGEFVHIFHGAEEAYKTINTVADNAIPDVKPDVSSSVLPVPTP